MTTLLLYRDDLAPGRCETPGCTHDDEELVDERAMSPAGWRGGHLPQGDVFAASLAAHLRDARLLVVIYHKETGIAEMRCKRCRKDVAALQVAWRTPGAGLQWPADPRAGYGFAGTP